MQYLHYQQTGQGSDIILIHGLFGSLDNLGMVAKGLKDNYRVTSVDVRNHGQSFHQNTMSYDELAQDVINVMDKLSIKSAHILGHSMGGKIAMQLAVNHPDRVDKLMVADIAPVAYPPHHQTIIDGLLAINLDQITSRKDADQQLAQYVEDQGVRQFLLRNIGQTDGKFYFKCHLANIAHCYPQIMSAMSLEHCFEGKTLFIKGGNSDYIQAEHRSVIQTLFPNSSAKIIQNTGHWLHAEKPTAFNKIINDFLISQ
ncbi:alpha/beta fold hydrolase [Thalassotalea agariperforans]